MIRSLLQDLNGSYEFFDMARAVPQSACGVWFSRKGAKTNLGRKEGGREHLTAGADEIPGWKTLVWF